MQAGEGNRSAFFINTAAREARLPPLERRIRSSTKAFLLFLVVFGTDYIFIYNDAQHHPRRLAVAGCSAIFAARLTVQIFFIWQRSISWKEIVMEAMGIIPISLFSFAYFAIFYSDPAQYGGVVDASGLALFLLGTWMNLWPEVQRTIWKNDPSNL